MPRPSRPCLRNERSQSTWLVTAVICAVNAVGCSDFKPEDDTYVSTLQGAKPPDWSCLSRQTAGELPLPGVAGENIFYTLELVDLATLDPMTNVEVRACGLTDIGCRNPVTGDEPIKDNGAGLVSIPLTSNFDGYLEIVSPTAVPYLFRLPSTGLRTMTDFPLAMISLASFGDLLEAFRLDLTQAQTLGSIGVRAFDCDGDPAPGVELTSNAQGTRWYFSGGVPDLIRETTDLEGLGGFVGSDTGVKDLTAELPNGRVVSKQKIVVRPSWMAAGYLKANPDEE
jgi:hypothetical protein